MVRHANLINEPVDNISNILPRRQKLLFRNLESKWVIQPQTYPFREYYSMILWNWNISLHWMYKFKFDTNYKVPEPKKGRLAYMKEFGVWLGSIFNLCEITVRWRDYLDVDYISYPDSERWFKLIAHEIKNTQFNHIGKTASTEALRDDLQILKEQENPYDPIKRKHTWKLIDASLRLLKSNKAPSFQKEQWTVKRKKFHLVRKDLFTPIHGC